MDTTSHFPGPHCKSPPPYDPDLRRGGVQVLASTPARPPISLLAAWRGSAGVAAAVFTPTFVVVGGRSSPAPALPISLLPPWRGSTTSLPPYPPRSFSWRRRDSDHAPALPISLLERRLRCGLAFATAAVHCPLLVVAAAVAASSRPEGMSPQSFPRRNMSRRRCGGYGDASAAVSATLYVLKVRCDFIGVTAVESTHCLCLRHGCRVSGVAEAAPTSLARDVVSRTGVVWLLRICPHQRHGLLCGWLQRAEGGLSVAIFYPRHVEAAWSWRRHN